MRILYLENHAVFAEQVIKQFLSEHLVLVVPSLALARSKLSDSNFDLILVDYDLDDGKGDEMVLEIRKKDLVTPIIATSSHERGNAALLQAGASAICDKMHFQEIGEVISRVQRSSIQPQ